MKVLAVVAGVAALASGGAALAQTVMPPKLVVAISVDQFSADVFAEYRRFYTKGLARLSQGVVFPSGYQGHAATETCPGHSTILTGARPYRTGIIANYWFQLGLSREDKQVYCSEDPSVPGASSSHYTVSPLRLNVPTLGDRLKVANPKNRVVAVAGKDRAAIMMGGHETDQVWYWGGRQYVTLADRANRPVPASVARMNAAVTAALEHKAAIPTPDWCGAKAQAVQTGQRTVGVVSDRPAGDIVQFRASGEFDNMTADLAIGLLEEFRLGRSEGVDVLAIGLSATDYVGHRYGTEGAEMCAQVTAVDATVGRILEALDRTGAPYIVVLTADHGGHDLPERHENHAFSVARRIDAVLNLDSLNQALAREFGLTGRIVFGESVNGDLYLARDLPIALRPRIVSAIRARLLAHSDVEAVFTAEELAATLHPTLPPTEWTLAQRFRESFDPARSGDLLVALKPNVTPIAARGGATVATHGSPWDYDRRVPILFYQPGMTGFEQPLPIETVDILPTLASLIGLPVPAVEIDGRCLDLDPGPASTCSRR